jgi:hypothetical protein
VVPIGICPIAGVVCRRRPGGATLRQDLDDNTTLYGKPPENRDIVRTGVRAPAVSLIALLNRYSAKEHTR